MSDTLTTDLPKVSVVLPTYNGALYLKQSINSCLSQTYKNIELIIVDDCSTDNTPEILSSFNDPRIKIIRHETNKGLPLALNTGFANATGDFLTWTSDDNYYVDNAIEKKLAFLMKNGSSFVYCDFYKINGDDSKVTLECLDDVLRLDIGNGVGPCFLYSRPVKDVVGDYDPQTRLAEDYDYWIRVSKTFSMKHLSEPLYFYRDHVGSLTQKRFYEVKVVDLLVKSKNKILTDRAVAIFAYICARNYPRAFWLRRIVSRLLKKKILLVLHAFEAKELSYKDAKLALEKIMKVNHHGK
jgi:glycosyltransferase involved in cell wall biosynthesis